MSTVVKVVVCTMSMNLSALNLFWRRRNNVILVETKNLSLTEVNLSTCQPRQAVVETESI